MNNFICHTLKKAYPWLSDAPAWSLQCVSADLSAAFKAFFRKDDVYPKFKTKHRSKKSFRIPRRGKVDVEESRVCSCVRSMASVNEEKDSGYFREAP